MLAQQDSGGDSRVLFLQRSSSVGLLFPAASAVWLPAVRSDLAALWDTLRSSWSSCRVGKPGTDFPLPVHVIDRRRCRKGLTRRRQRTTECFSLSAGHSGVAICSGVVVVRRSRTDDCDRLQTSIAVSPREAICLSCWRVSDSHSYRRGAHVDPFILPMKTLPHCRGQSNEALPGLLHLLDKENFTLHSQGQRYLMRCHQTYWLVLFCLMCSCTAHTQTLREKVSSPDYKPLQNWWTLQH